MRRTTEKQRLLWGLILLVGLGLYAYSAYVLWPLARAVITLSQQVREASTQAHQTEQLVAQAPTVQQDHARLQAEVERLRDTLPSDDELPMILERLSELASHTGVKILSIFPRRPDQKTESVETPPGSELYKPVAIEIEALTGFHQFGMFLSRAESEHQPLEVVQLQMSHSERELRRHTIKLVLLTYVTITHEQQASSPQT